MRHGLIEGCQHSVGLPAPADSTFERSLSTEKETRSEESLKFDRANALETGRAPIGSGRGEIECTGCGT